MAREEKMVNTHITREMVVSETPKAVQVFLAAGVTRFGGGHRVWVPKSQIKWIAEGVYAETLHMPEWLARKTFG